MLGGNMLAELKALARNHGLATGSQTVPNSAVEKAIVCLLYTSDAADE